MIFFSGWQLTKSNWRLKNNILILALFMFQCTHTTLSHPKHTKFECNHCLLSHLNLKFYDRHRKKRQREDNGFTQREYTLVGQTMELNMASWSKGKNICDIWIFTSDCQWNISYLLRFDALLLALRSGLVLVLVFLLWNNLKMPTTLRGWVGIAFFSVLFEPRIIIILTGMVILSIGWVVLWIFLTLIKGDCEIRISIKSRIDLFLRFDSMNCSGSVAEKIFRIGIK